MIKAENQAWTAKLLLDYALKIILLSCIINGIYLLVKMTSYFHYARLAIKTNLVQKHTYTCVFK